MFDFLISQEIPPSLIDDIKYFRHYYQLEEHLEERIPSPHFKYYGRDIWIKAITTLLEGEHLLLSGPKATGKNVLADNLAYYFGRPTWNISFHVNIDSQTLIGSDTFRNNEVVLRKGPIYQTAYHGGFGIFDEINMAKNDAIAVIHSALDYRRIIDVPGYEKIKLHDATRFIGTMNYGYVGTRELNEALVSRFLVIDMPILDKEGIKKILMDEHALTEDAANLFSQFFLDVQKKSLNSEISSKPIDLRGLLSAIHTIRRGLPIKDALEIGIVNKSFDHFERQLVMDIIHSIFPNHLQGNELFETR